VPTITTVPPRVSGTNNSKIERSKHNEVEASTADTSQEVKTSFANASRAVALRCSMATPFGWPV
jgi:hypothetical protein